ncbi:hypothetical protein AGDE_09811 [Angomonas deanei]|uniref:Rab-GTPase-TBC domain containing protein, putative n=1 Tax=Angomonas deanei TaxID=59799 RepID=A0A7G2CEU0_9TRYP|nr:hypothetical protein AGDE_09811 [Angomonas deanei]CAD2218276.1 Rab-GTPase-TBC domain containing protein, putative [Angomonas deanei]|eukprot:EPY29800.1 hypothetical protein AGDE_09811 [Angomonas deanei]
MSTAESPKTEAKVTLEEAKTALFEILDKKTPNTWEQVEVVQKACMRLPTLSTLLTGEKRCQLYEKLLYDEHTKILDLPDNLAEYATKASETHESVAKQLSPLMGPSVEGVSEAELKGFVCYLGTEKGFRFGEKQVGIFFALAAQFHDVPKGDAKANLKRLLNLSVALREEYLISSTLYEKATLSLLRLLLQYHDPALSEALDHQKIEVGRYLLDWSSSLFAKKDDHEAAVHVLDWILILLERNMVPYAALAFLMSNRQAVMGFRTEEETTEYLQTLSFKFSYRKESALNAGLVDGRRIAPLPIWSGKSLMQNADLLVRNTPLSAQNVLECCLWPDTAQLSKSPEALAHHYSLTPCLPIERSDFATSFSTKDATRSAALDYVVIDSRARVSYEHANLPGSIFVGDVAGYDQERLEQLVSRVEEKAKGSHVCVLGTGRAIDEEKNLLKLIAMQLVRKHLPYVGLLYVGFKGLIPMIKQKMIVANLQHPEDMAEETAPLFTNAALDAALDTISSNLPTSEEVRQRAEEVRQKAEELGSLAKERAEAARSWGLGVFSQLQEKISEVRSQGLFTPSTEEAKGTSAASTEPSLIGRIVRPSIAAAFSMGGEADPAEGDDDFDLITSVPKPMKSALPAEETAKKEAQKPQAAPAAAPKPAVHADPTADPNAKKVDEEFEKLFM